MAASKSQPLLDAKNNTIVSCKLIYSIMLLISAVSLVSFFVLLPDQQPPTKEIQSHQSVSFINLCSRAHNQEECSKFVSEVSATNDKVAAEKDGQIILKKFLANYVHQLDNAIAVAKGTRNHINGFNELGPVEDCLELMDLSMDRVRDSVTALASSSATQQSQSLADVHTWLSSLLTNHVTCIDGLNNSSSLRNITEDLIVRARTSLAMVAKLIPAAIDNRKEKEMLLPSKRRSKKFPSWVTKKDRKLLESSAVDGIKADLVVAQDGTGNYRTISEAISAAPSRSTQRFVIYVKLGTYEEHIEVPSKKTNLMIVGDGMDLTIVTGSLSVDGGSTTYRSATFGKYLTIYIHFFFIINHIYTYISTLGMKICVRKF